MFSLLFGDYDFVYEIGMNWNTIRLLKDDQELSFQIHFSSGRTR